jgi:hypothetical protein
MAVDILPESKQGILSPANSTEKALGDGYDEQQNLVPYFSRTQSLNDARTDQGRLEDKFILSASVDRLIQG